MATLPPAVTATGAVTRPDPPALRRVRRRRRPSGEAPPLPRHLNASGKWWLAMGAGVVVISVVVALTGAAPLVEVAETRVLQGFEAVRSGALTAVATAVGLLAAPRTLHILWLANLAVLIVFRR